MSFVVDDPAKHLKVAMGNADPKLKAIADYVTDDVDQDGIYNIRVKLGFIKTKQ